MAKVALIALEGDTESWLVDFAAGTVTPADASHYAAARTPGVKISKGIDLAVVAETRGSAASFEYSTT